MRKMKINRPMLIAACLCSMTPAWAETTGQQKIEASKSEFRVCADPDNLPFTNQRGEGFENKIAEVLAQSANQPLAYYWWPERRDFVNKTLNAWECDVIIGVPKHDDMVRTTRPYYCSRYVTVHRPDQSITPSVLGTPEARSLRIGVVERTPPLDMLLQRNLDPIVYFTDYDDATNPPGRIVTDVATGKVDLALVWGPVGGYFARRQAVPLEIEALEGSADPRTRLTYPISFGVRRDDKARSARLEGLARERVSEIQAILSADGLPLLEDPDQCGPLLAQAERDPAPPEPAPRAQLLMDATTAAETAGPAYVQKVADQTSSAQSATDDNITCTGTETMQDIQKLAVGSPTTEIPYKVQNGAVDAKTYSGWIRFAAFCQTCHGTGGVGSAIAPDLAQALKSLNKQQFETIVSCGLKGNLGTGVMPAWGSNPNIHPYTDNLWDYLKARADGALGPGRPQKLSATTE
jgi:mxaJ protein